MLPLKSLLLAAHLRVIALLAGERDVLTGLVTHGRLEELDGERSCGLYLNTLPLRVRLPEGSWSDLVRASFEAEWETLPFRRYPLAAIQQRQGSGELFEATFNYVNFHVLGDLFRSQRLQALDFSVGSEPSNLTLAVTFYSSPQTEDFHLELMMDYLAAALTDEQVAVITNYYIAALTAIAHDPSSRWETTPLLSPGERQQVLVEWNATQVSYPTEVCVHELVAVQAARSPDAVAVVFEGQAMSYRELDVGANQLAHELRARGVGPEVRVAVCLERSPELVVALLGVLKAGGAYVPLDPGYPADRLAFMVSDAQARLVLTSTGLQDRVTGRMRWFAWTSKQPRLPVIR